MGVTISSVLYIPRTLAYTVFFQSSSKVRDVKFDPSGVIVLPNLGGGFSGTYIRSITFGDEGDIPGVPYYMNAALPAYIKNPLTFGKTAE